MLEFRSFCETLEISDFPQISNLLLSCTEWDSVKTIASTLEHFAIQTESLQKEKISLSDFFGGWAKIKMEMVRLGDNELALALLVQMKSREEVLFNNSVLNAAVFLDPRFQQYMPNKRKESAISFLSELDKKINDFERAERTNNILNVSSCSSINQDFEQFLSTIYENEDDQNTIENQSNEQPNQPVSKNIEIILNEFIGTKEPLKSSVFDYWEANKNMKPELYKLATVVLAVPPTQTSIERAFSAMALILNPLRTQLSDENLENSLLIRLNRILYDEMFHLNI